MELILDASNLQHRSYWIGSAKHQIHSTDGVDVGGIYIFLRSLRSLVKELKPTKIWACWDKKLIWPSTNFRKVAFQAYKQQRNNAEFKSMYDQEVLLFSILEALGICNIHPRVLEADDVISWLSQKISDTTIIASSDKDLLQLVTPKTSFYNLIQKELVTVENFLEKIGIAPELYLRWKAIQGDASDNIPKLKGYGPKKAQELATNWDLTVLSVSEKQQLSLNLLLMNLKDSFLRESEEVEYYEEQFAILQQIQKDFPTFKKLCEYLKFNTILKEYENWVQVFG